MNIFKPFQELKKFNTVTITVGWLIILFVIWGLNAMGTTHIFPTPMQVLHGFSAIYNEGLITHLGSSLALCFQGVLYAVIISLLICYASPLPALKPIAVFCSKFRYLPLTGISFYVGIFFKDARNIQIWVLVIFMATYLITSLLAMIKDIPNEEFDHARSLGCNRWEMLWEVVIKGRFDYVIEAVRQNLAIVWMMLVTVESILVATGGLGVIIKNSDRGGDNGRVVAVQIIIILIGLLLDFLLTKTRKLSFRYSNF